MLGRYYAQSNYNDDDNAVGVGPFGRIFAAAENDGGNCPAIVFDPQQGSIRCEPGAAGDAYCANTFSAVRSDTCDPATRTCVAKPASLDDGTLLLLLSHYATAKAWCVFVGERGQSF
jgi:hypothetical protein